MNFRIKYKHWAISFSALFVFFLGITYQTLLLLLFPFDMDSKTSLVHAAASCNDKILMRCLLASGTDVNEPSPGFLHGLCPCHPAQLTGETPLHTALRGSITDGHAPTLMVSILVRAGADVNARVSEECDTPLHLAAQVGNPDVVQALLKAGVSLNTTSYYGTSLHALIEGMCLNMDDEEGVLSSARILLKRGADPTLADRQGRTPIQCANLHGFFDLLIPLRSHLAIYESASRT